MSLTYTDVQEILRIIDQSENSELHLEIDDFKLIVRRHGAPSTTAPGIIDAPPVMKAQRSADSAGSPGADPTIAAAEIGSTGSTAPSSTAVALRSPLAGTFYRAPSPGAEPFTEEGAVVEAGTTVCILDVMKVMNMLKAPCRGRVHDIVVGNAEAVSGGEVLIWFEPQ